MTTFSGLEVQDNLKARAGGGQATAFQLSGDLVRITNVATAGDSVKLPSAAPGRAIIVINHGTRAMQLFGQPGDKINDVASATGISMSPGSVAWFSSVGYGNWYGTVGNFSGGYSTVSTVETTAHAGGGQASATVLTASYNPVTTVASAGDSVKLPAGLPGMLITVTNADPTNSMDVFPASGETINELSADTALALTHGKTATFFCAIAGNWRSLLTA